MNRDPQQAPDVYPHLSADELRRACLLADALDGLPDDRAEEVVLAAVEMIERGRPAEGASR